MDAQERLFRCERELVRLRVENEQLRRSAEAFGELAERLNAVVRELYSAGRRQALMRATSSPVDRQP